VGRAAPSARPSSRSGLSPPPSRSPISWLVSTGPRSPRPSSFLAVVFAGAGIFFCPGLLLLRAFDLRLPNAITNAIASFVLSVVGVSLAWILGRGLLEGVGSRGCLYLTVAGLDAMALAAAVFFVPGARALPVLAPPSAGRGRAELIIPACGVLLALAAGCLLFPGKLTIEALSGEAAGVRALGASLFSHALPQGPLASGSWGFHPVFPGEAYPVFFSLAVVGPCEAAVRLPALLFLGLTMLSVADLAARGRSRAAGGSLNFLLPILVTGFLSMQVGAWYAGHDPGPGDLGGLPRTQWQATALALGALLLLRDRTPPLAALAGLLATAVFPVGSLLVGLLVIAGIAFGSAPDRQTMGRAGIVFAGALTGLALAFTVRAAVTGTWDLRMPEGPSALGRETGVGGAVGRIGSALGTFGILGGGLALAGLPLALWRGDRMARLLASVGAVWALGVLATPARGVHLFLPIALLPLAAALRTAAVVSRRRRGALLLAGALTLSALACIVLSRPPPAP
jgi:hypothetical protein